MLECVINISEGRRSNVIDAIRDAGGDHVLDVHVDADHHRSVLTLAGSEIEVRAFEVVRAAVERIDVSSHEGAHPRLGAADVVPFVPLGGSSIDDAVTARDRVASRIAEELDVPCFLYGPERPLPDVRRHAFTTLAPDRGPGAPHPTAGACCVGARPPLVAFNLWLAAPASLADARKVAAAIRRPGLRTLGLDIGGRPQVSCNLVDPTAVGPDVAYDLVAEHAAIERAELVGLLPEDVLASVPPSRWSQLDVSAARTIEARLKQAGLGGS